MMNDDRMSDDESPPNMPRLFGKQDKAMEALEPGQVLFKLGSFKFGACDQSFLIERMATTNTELYEIIQGPSRLYVDAEHMFDVEPSAQNLKEWFSGLMSVLCKSIVDNLPVLRGAERKYQVLNDSRASGGQFKASFHIVWTDIVFQSNTNAMKKFCVEHFDGKLMTMQKYTYIFHDKNGKPEIRSSVDKAVYTTRRAFRLPYAVKEGKRTFLKPWDDFEWCPIELAGTDKEDYIEKSLVCYQDDAIVPIADPDEREVQRPRKRRRVLEDDEEKEPEEAKEPERAPVDQEELEKVRQLVAVLSRDRASGRKRGGPTAGTFEVWSHVIWCISNLFGASEVGEVVAQSFSSRGDNYDKNKTASTYYRAKPGTWSVGSMVKWALEDDRAKAQVILRSFEHQVERNENQYGPCLNINVLKELLSTEYAKLDEVKEDGDKSEIEAQMTVIYEASMPYLNNYLLMVTDCNPSVFGEEKLDHFGNKTTIWTKSLEDLKKANGPLKGHINYWAHSPLMRKYNTTFVDMATIEHETNAQFETARFNLFTGFEIPKDYDKFPDNYEELCKPILDHLFRIWCKCDEAIFKFVLNWFAMTLQFPERKITVGIIIKGSEGAGKGLMVQKLSDIMGSKYFFQVSNAKKELYGTFKPEGFDLNKLLLIDEATFGGSHEQEGMLKTLLTEKTINIEHKYLGRKKYDSFSNVLVVTNGEWPCHMGPKERRWLAIEVDDSHAGVAQKEYFAPIVAVPTTAWAKFLYSRDLTDWDPTDIPRTEFMREQKQNTMSALEAWWELCLVKGTLYQSELLPNAHYLVKWPDEAIQVVVGDLYHSYTAYGADQKKQSRLLGENIFAKQFKRLMKLDDVRKVGGRENRSRVYDVPCLEECKRRFRAYFNDPDWNFE